MFTASPSLYLFCHKRAMADIASCFAAWICTLPILGGPARRAWVLIERKKYQTLLSTSISFLLSQCSVCSDGKQGDDEKRTNGKNHLLRIHS
jgi:hypothetical protein